MPLPSAIHLGSVPSQYRSVVSRRADVHLSHVTTGDARSRNLCSICDSHYLNILMAFEKHREGTVCALGMHGSPPRSHHSLCSSMPCAKRGVSASLLRKRRLPRPRALASVRHDPTCARAMSWWYGSSIALGAPSKGWSIWWGHWLRKACSSRV